MGRKAALPPVDAHPVRIAEGLFPRRAEQRGGGASAEPRAPGAGIAGRPASEGSGGGRAAGPRSNGKRTRDAP